MSRLSDLIKSHLDAHPGLEKQELAKRAGITPQSLSGYLNGKASMKQYPDIRHMQGLAKAMGMDFLDVLHAITEDLGGPGTREPIRPDLAVAIAELKKLEPQRVRSVAQIIATMIDDRT